MSSVSPRSSALSRASSMKRSRHDMSDFTDKLEANILPVLLVAAVVAAGVVAWVAHNYEQVVTAHGWRELFTNGFLAGVTLLAVLGCVAWVTAHAYMHSDKTIRMVLLGIFVAAAALLVAIAWFYFRRDDVTVAFYLTVALVAGVLVHTYFCWRALAVMGVAAMVPAVLLGAFLLWQFWPSSSTTVSTA